MRLKITKTNHSFDIFGKLLETEDSVFYNSSGKKTKYISVFDGSYFSNLYTYDNKGNLSKEEYIVFNMTDD